MLESFMRQAIEEAKKSSEPLKCGAVIVKDDQVLVSAHNTQRTENNACAHAEINAIIAAGRLLDSKNLNNCEIFCTCEPCVMCLSAIAYAKIKKLYFGVNLKDVSPMEKIINIDLETFLEKSPYRMEVIKNFLEEECWVLYQM